MRRVRDRALADGSKVGALHLIATDHHRRCHDAFEDRSARQTNAATERTAVTVGAMVPAARKRSVSDQRRQAAVGARMAMRGGVTAN